MRYYVEYGNASLAYRSASLKMEPDACHGSMVWVDMRNAVDPQIII